MQHQNRALNGDIVCIEIMPENKWISNYRSTEPVNALLDEAQEVENVVSDADDAISQEDATPKINMIDRINSETEKQAIGMVRGVLKKLNKTYGGSIIKKQDMMKSTRQKFDQFCENHGITDPDKQNQFRVFVPYST